MQENLYVVIMAGGGGLRLWPASTRRAPKQFLDLVGEGQTLLQSAFARACHFTAPSHVLVITAAEYVGLVSTQLPTLPTENIVGEPRKCNTAPCLALAALWIAQHDPRGAQEATMLVLSSDHHIPDLSAFAQSVEVALQHTAAHPEALVTFGLKPLRPETGYGYIHTSGEGEVAKVLAFKEKPDRETAEAYCRDGQHLWNSGIFVWRVAALSASLERFLPQVVASLSPLQKSGSWAEELPAAYAVCPEVSIDNGILERSPEVSVVRADFPWSDLGSWRSIATYMPQDASGNAGVVGTYVARDSHHNIFHTPSGRLVAAIGLEGYIVAWHGDELLICPVGREQEIRQLVKGLEDAAPEHV